MFKVVLHNIKYTNVTDFSVISQSLKFHLITLNLRLMENISHLIFCLCFKIKLDAIIILASINNYVEAIIQYFYVSVLFLND